jgi:superfamily I DNA/RNA helicase
MHEPSFEQSQIVTFTISHPTENVGIIAYAGSGKTTTLVDIAKAKPLHQSIIAVAFARPNALDFKRCMPINVESGTLHSFGLAAVKEVFGACTVQGTNKTYKIGDKFGIRVNKKFPQLPRIISFIKSQGLVPWDTLEEEIICSLSEVHSFLEDTDQAWLEVFDRLNVCSDMEDDEMIELCRKFLAESIKQSLGHNGAKPVHDYDDMIYIPACFTDGKALPKPRVLLIDEAQDLNPTQHACVGFMGEKETTQVILVGDPNQAIYAFRGADAESFYSLIDHFDCKLFSLSYTFRSDQSITTHAQGYVPDMETFSSKLGEVNKPNSWSPDDIQLGSAILCRNTMPLVGVFYKLIRAGLPAKIKGSEIGKGLISILKSKITGDTVRDVRISIDNWYIAEEAKAKRNNCEHRLGPILEQAAILGEVAKRAGDEVSGAFGVKDIMLSQLSQMFTDDVPKVCLATIHKAKGLEWDTVWFLDSWLIPSRYATQDWELQQEKNLSYVAITRAKHCLNYINTKDLV